MAALLRAFALVALCCVPVRAGLTGLEFAGTLPFVSQFVEDLVPSPDGEFLYLGQLTGTFATNGAILVLSRNTATGALTPVGQVALFGIRFPKDLAMSPDGTLLFGVGDGLRSYGRNVATGQLTVADLVAENGTAVAVSPDGAHLYVGRSGELLAYAVDGGGTLSFIEAYMQGVLDVDGLDGDVTAMVQSPDGEHLYVLAYGAPPTRASTLTTFDRDPGTGTLSFVETLRAGDQGTIPSFGFAFGLAVSADGANVYATSLDAEALLTFSRDAGTGRLTFVSAHATTPKVSFPIALSPDDATLYGLDRRSPGGSLTVFRRTAGSGVPVPVQHFVDDVEGIDGIDFPFAVAATPDGADVYVASHTNGTDGDIAQFRTRSLGCNAMPRAGCVAPGAAEAAILVVRTKGDGTTSLKWKWKGTASQPTFGTPVTAGGFSACLYDASGSGQPLVDASMLAGGLCPRKACWRAQSTGFKYKAGKLNPEGVKKLLLKAGTFPRGGLKVAAAGPNLVGPMLPLTAPVTIQLQRQDAADCWEATFSTPLTNDSFGFKAKAD